MLPLKNLARKELITYPCPILAQNMLVKKIPDTTIKYNNKYFLFSYPGCQHLGHYKFKLRHWYEWCKLRNRER